VIIFFFENVDFLHLDTLVSQLNSSCPSRKNPCANYMSSNPPLAQLDFPHMDQIPSFMHQFMENMVGVEGDDHCRFRVVSSLFGRYVDARYIIRLVLTREPNNDLKHYIHLFGIKNQCREVKQAMLLLESAYHFRIYGWLCHILSYLLYKSISTW